MMLHGKNKAFFCKTQADSCRIDLGGGQMVWIVLIFSVVVGFIVAWEVTDYYKGKTSEIAKKENEQKKLEDEQKKLEEEAKKIEQENPFTNADDAIDYINNTIRRKQ